MSITSLLITVVILAVAGYFGWLRPTGLAGRTSSEREQDAQRNAVAKWLKKDGE